MPKLSDLTDLIQAAKSIAKGDVFWGAVDLISTIAGYVPWGKLWKGIAELAKATGPLFKFYKAIEKYGSAGLAKLRKFLGDKKGSATYEDGKVKISNPDGTKVDAEDVVKGAVFKVINTDIAAALKRRINHIRKITFESKGTSYKFSGCHSISAIDELKGKARIEITIPKNSEGVYEAKVFAKDPTGIERLKSGNGGKSTFFPDDWGEARILNESEHAIKNNRGRVPPEFTSANNMYYGFSKDGKIKIEFYYDDATGNISSFFPSLNNY